MQNRQVLPITFVAISSLVFTLEAYLLIIKTTLHPQFFITTCGEVLKNIQEHVHFNPDGVLFSLILLVTVISVSLALWQLLKFIVSHRRLYQFRIEEMLPDNLIEIINKHGLSSNSVVVVKNTKLIAYTIGLFKPKIIVSKALTAKLSLEQLEAVILHELYHMRSRHLLWILLSRLISSLFFFIPLIEYLARQLRTAFELAADAFVVEKQKTRDHLCGSLALNIQYAGGVMPHFATSPIERRIESLVSNQFSFERVGIKSVAVSILSLALMLGMAFIQPNQVTANFSFESGGVCSVEKDCQTTDCFDFKINNFHHLPPLVSTSFLFSSSH